MVTDTAYSLGEPAPPALIKTFAPNRVVDVPLKFLSIEEGSNVRDFTSFENKDHLKRLAVLIAEKGVETPIIVRIAGESRIVISDGECRVRAAHAAREAGSKKVATIPALLDFNLDDPAGRIESLVVKNTGKPLAMLETLEVVKRLRALGKTNPEIQSALGFSRYHMQNLGLLDLATPPVREYIRLGRIAPTTVVEVIRDNRDDLEAAEKGVLDAVKRVEKQEAKGAAPGGKVTKSKVAPGEVVYTRSTFHGLIRVLQRLLAEMTPATEYRKFRNWVRAALENAGAPLEAEEDDGE
jgi:ParB-like chromosome segregation protein Spo0J